MARLNFRFTPRDTADFDVCAGPPRPGTAPAARRRRVAAPAPAAPRTPNQPEPAEG